MISRGNTSKKNDQWRKTRPSFRRPINRSRRALPLPRFPRVIPKCVFHKEIHGCFAEKKSVVPTLTRTNAPMNNRVILFREPIRLSAARKSKGMVRDELYARGGREREIERGGPRRSESRDEMGREKNDGEARRAAASFLQE